jgi:hypothetical protein
MMCCDKVGTWIESHPKATCGWICLCILAMMIVALIVPWNLPPTVKVGVGGKALIAWILDFLLILVILALIGRGIDGTKPSFWRVLVDSRNRISLSRFQIVLWTVVIVSAFWTIVLARVSDSIQNPGGYQCANGSQACAAPCDVTLPPLLWALMGISLSSTVASGVILENKARRTEAEAPKSVPTWAALTDAEKIRESWWPEGTAGKEFTNRGAVAIRNDDQSPSFLDMFKGDNTGDLSYVDFGKVQSFFFTVVAVVTYAAALGAEMVGTTAISTLVQFPPLSEGLVIILGISHAGYLAGKAAITPLPTPKPPTPQQADNRAQK